MGFDTVDHNGTHLALAVHREQHIVVGQRLDHVEVGALATFCIDEQQVASEICVIGNYMEVWVILFSRRRDQCLACQTPFTSNQQQVRRVVMTHT